MVSKLDDVTKIIASGEEFTDKEFPPNLSSLTDGNHNNFTEANTKYFKTIVWKRASQIFAKEDLSVFKDINPLNIV
jgi:hypothetical protein